MFPGFNKAKRGTISKGDWDRDGVKNKKDCEPLNFRRQGEGHEMLVACAGCGHGQMTDWKVKAEKGKKFSCPKCKNKLKFDEDLNLKEDY